jgi:hypothetical protein
MPNIASGGKGGDGYEISMPFVASLHVKKLTIPETHGT